MICLIVAGALAAALPGEEFSLSWTHSVEKTVWEEDWRAEGGRMIAVEARIQGSGAGMEPPDHAVRRGGWWVWRPDLAPLAELSLARSEFTPDYTICIQGECRPMAELAPPGPTRIRPCDS
ncbi:DUF1850 domain-containing protein [Telmatospirillum sp. J64-1]|uniref:DUF1850 domain-containing protein n=1 Tax=Telmatospirillum sp. J64-1 TaxID=2502183 RepID=UPI0021031F92|nr:DUF1850 domain-containing protein [Telmatospirillum sp. J64-1]